MKKVNKFLYGWKFFVDYGGGWEYEIFEETYQAMKVNKKAYLENCPYPLKVSIGRETNPAYREASA